MTRKRILFVEQNQDGTIGGSHHSLLLLVQHLDRSRFEPVVAFYERHGLLDEFARHAKVVILPVAVPLNFGASVESRGLGRLLVMCAQKCANGVRSSAASIARIATVALTIRPALIHLNNSVSSSGYEWLVAARLCGARWVTHQRGFSPSVPAAAQLDRVICISRAVAKDVAARTPVLAGRVVQIYNGIDVDAYVKRATLRSRDEVRHEFHVGPNELLIGLIGNIQEWKGQDVLLKALPLLRSTRGWRCVLVGDTPTDGREFGQRLHRFVETLGLKDRVTFTGYRSDVSAIVNGLDIVVHTSVLPEPMGRVILEGMALGKPVVATDHGGPKEILDDGQTGFLTKPGDPEALAVCLDRLLELPELRARVGAAAKTHVGRTFSAAEYARRVQDVYLSFWPELRVSDAVVEPAAAGVRAASSSSAGPTA